VQFNHQHPKSFQQELWWEFALQHGGASCNGHFLVLVDTPKTTTILQT
jgi:hypothetical protein